MRNLRCKGTLHGVASNDAKGTLEVKCKRRVCGSSSGVVVFHTFDLASMEYTTQQFAEPPRTRKVSNGIR